MTRWLSRDPLGEFAELSATGKWPAYPPARSINLYRYALNDPLNFTDVLATQDGALTLWGAAVLGGETGGEWGSLLGPVGAAAGIVGGALVVGLIIYCSADPTPETPDAPEPFQGGSGSMVLPHSPFPLTHT
jgi:hypothetical protein